MFKLTKILLVALCLLIYNTVFSQTINSIQFEGKLRTITFEKGTCPLDYHSIAGERWQHLQDMIRLPDANGKEYYMGTFSQNCSDSEGGLVFVAAVNKGGTNGNVVWCDQLTNRHAAGGYNHPGDLRRVGNTIIIAGQNWAGSTASSIGTFFGGDDMDKGNGGNHVLFYDISNPASPRYTGKLNRCQNKVATSDIDAISAAKIGNEYFLSFNGVSGGSVTCKCNQFTPNGNWQVVSGGKLDGMSNIDYKYGGQTITGGVQLKRQSECAWVTYDKLDSRGRRINLVDSPLPKTSFGSGTTFNMSALNNGRGAVVYTNVESDSRIEIQVIETTPQMRPITDLYLVFGRGAQPPTGYTMLPVDLNRDAGGDDIHLCYTTDPSIGSPITSVQVKFDTGRDFIPSGYKPFGCNRNDSKGLCDVNRDAGGKDIFMFYSTDRSKGQPIYMADIVIGRSTNLQGWNRLEEDLNAGAGGDDLFLTFYSPN